VTPDNIEEPARILVVCSANRCRSPLAGALLQNAIAARGIDAVVATAGFGNEGQFATSTTRRVATARGLDLESHRSRRYDGRLDDIDLVIGMERSHVRDVVVAAPASWPKTYTFKELVRRGEEIGARTEGESLGGWLDRLHAGRRSADMMGSSPDDDVADPVAGTQIEHEETLEELDDLVERFVILAWPESTISWSG
jgi:protein-tyrosine phosphatase